MKPVDMLKLVADPLDGKVHGVLWKNKDGQVIPADEFVVFRPADTAFFQILPTYLHHLKVLGADKAQLDAVEHLINKIGRWRAAHPERCKVADVAPGELPPSW